MSKNKNSGFMKALKLSDALKNVIAKGEEGVVEMPRTQVMKLIWDYIKANNLQGEDKRMINPDAALAEVLGQDPISMFHIARALKDHLT